MLIGCIADDFTGAGDAASFLEKGGMRTLLFNGILDSGSFEETELEWADAVVIALKTRSLSAEAAVEQTRRAAGWLKDHGAEKFYIKYCSTFDSTREGNIGPVCDAMLEWTKERYTVLCPSLPVNGRTVKNGCLYAENVPLAESHMRDHPLNPMTDSRIKNLMDAQSRYPSYEIGKEYAAAGRLLREKLLNEPCYLIPDYETEEDGAAIAKTFRDCCLFTGGSGLLEGLARVFGGGAKLETSDNLRSADSGDRDDRVLILAGSCSKATLQQISAFRRTGRPSYKIDPDRLLEGRQSLEEIKRFIENSTGHILIYSSDTIENRNKSNYSQSRRSAILEQALSESAVYAAEAGIRRLVAAGGETSGAVMKKLDYKIFRIGKNAAPGVPVLIPARRPQMRIVRIVSCEKIAEGGKYRMKNAGFRLDVLRKGKAFPHRRNQYI